MRADEIREMGKDDIVARIRDLEEERFRLQFRSATEPRDLQIILANEPGQPQRKREQRAIQQLLELRADLFLAS